jgi:hypothetical protein
LRIGDTIPGRSLPVKLNPFRDYCNVFLRLKYDRYLMKEQGSHAAFVGHSSSVKKKKKKKKKKTGVPANRMSICGPGCCATLRAGNAHKKSILHKYFYEWHENVTGLV